MCAQSQGGRRTHRPPHARETLDDRGHENKQGTELRSVPQGEVEEVFPREMPFESGLEIKVHQMEEMAGNGIQAAGIE